MEKEQSSNQCLCKSKTAQLCCPVDVDIRKEWLMKLETEYKSLGHVPEEIARKLRILSNPDRVGILLMLEQREHCMDEMARKLKAKKSAVSYHLKLLKEHDMICIKKRSRFAFYSLSHNGNKLIAAFKNI